MTDKMQDVDFIMAQPSLQAADRRCGEAVDPHELSALLIGQRLANGGPFPFDISLGRPRGDAMTARMRSGPRTVSGRGGLVTSRYRTTGVRSDWA